MIQDELLGICAATRQTVFMITHDVGEAILLADRIFLMSNGPLARIAEVVVNPLPKSRTRATIPSSTQSAITWSTFCCAVRSMCSRPHNPYTPPIWSQHDFMP